MCRPLLLFVLLLAGCSQPTAEQATTPFSGGRWIDLSYDFSAETPYWPTSEPFRLDTAFAGTTPGGYYYSAFNFCAAEHGGTHLDAPVHFAEGKWSTEQIPLESLTGQAVVIDVSEKVGTNPDYQITVADIEAWEASNGLLVDGAILLFHTGFGERYPDAGNYLGTGERGEGAVANLHFPGIDPAAAEWLTRNRKVKAIGIDTASIDFGQSKDFRTHQIFYGANIPGFENVANLDQLPAKGAYVVALPMKIKGGSGAPLRIVAWVQDV